MNPFKVNKVIKESHKEDKKISIDDLSDMCNGRVRHRYIKLSDDTFECESSGGFPRHRVLRLKLFSWITLWFYTPDERQGRMPFFDESDFEEPHPMGENK